MSDLDSVLAPAQGSPVVEVEEPRVFHWSASQVATFRDCPRKWFFDRVLRIKTPPKPSAEFGVRVHRLREAWFRDGVMPAGDTPEARCARAGLDELPGPRTPDMKVERFFRYRTQARDVVGLIDLYLPRGQDGKSPPLVIDHKTTGNEAWIKTPDDLIRGDPQTAIYAHVVAEETGSDVVDLFWHYIVKKRKPATIPVRVQVTRTQIADTYGACVEDAKRMLTIFTSGCKNSREVEFNLDACDAYGGCPFRDRCQVDNQTKLERMRKMGEGALEAMLAGFTGDEKKTETKLQEVVPPDAPAPDLTATEPKKAKAKTKAKTKTPRKSATAVDRRRVFVEECVLAQLRGRVNESPEDIVSYALEVADLLDRAES